jgi:limonene-1,2-epoxide hydrolase
MPFSGDAEDRLALRELIEAYADAVTRNDPIAWSALWVEHGTWALPDFPQIGTVHGREAIVALWREAMKQHVGVMFRAWPGSIEIDGTTAKVRSYTDEVHDQNGVTKRDRGVYEDVCVKVAGRWLFEHRCFRQMHSQS